jgi:hypothetical protein
MQNKCDLEHGNNLVWAYVGLDFQLFRAIHSHFYLGWLIISEILSKFVPNNKIDLTMCTVNIQVNEALLRNVMPELDSTAAIRLWAQNLINLQIEQLQAGEEETMDIEDARAMVHETIRKEYALP